MRRAIETAPRDGKVVLLEDDATGAFELARWSAEALAWVKENGELCKIKPTYWHATRRDENPLPEGDANLLDGEAGSGSASESPERPSLLSFLSRVKPPSPVVAPDVIAPRPAATPPPMNVAAIKSEIAPTRNSSLDGGDDDLMGTKPLSMRPKFGKKGVEQAGLGLTESSLGAAFPSTSDRVESQSPFVGSDSVPPRSVAVPSAMNVKSEIAKAQAGHGSAESSFAAALMAAFPSSSDRVESQSRFVAPNVVAPRPVAIPSPMNVTAVKSQITPGKAPAGRGFAVSSIAAAMIAASLIGMYFYFRAEVDTYVTQYVGQRNIARIGTSPRALQELDKVAPAPAPVRQQAEANGGSEQVLAAAAQKLPSNEVEDRGALTEERERNAALANELATARPEADAQAAQSTKSGADAEQLKRAAEAASLELRQSLQQEKERAEALTAELAKARQEIKVQAALSRTKSEEAAQLKRMAESATIDLQQSVQQQRERAEALAGELAKSRREIEDATQLKRTADNETAGMQQSVQQERERAEALAGELAKARRENEEAAQLKRTAESATTDLQQSLQQQRERAEALAVELATARREIEAQATLSRTKSEEVAQLKRTAESAPTGLQQERDRAEAMARRNAEAQAALSSNKDDEARRLKPALEAATTGLQQSALQERDKTGGPAAGPKSTTGPVDARLPFAPNDQTVKWRQAAAEQQAATVPKGEATRLLERANALLGEGNIGAARVVLERAAEIGSIQATFRLAETYDPLVLSIWRTYGTRGDATKARELYAKAYDGGIKAAKDRSDALQAAGLEAK